MKWTRLARLLVGISLTLLLLSPVWSGGIYLSWQRAKLKRAVKQEMLQQLPETALRKFVWPTASLADSAYWHHDGEFERQDTMYDVVSRQVVGSYTLLVCWPDDDESAVVQQIRQWSSQLFHNNPATQTFTHQWAMLLQSYCVPESPAIAPPMEVLRQWPLYSCMSVIPSCQETTTPPPECEQFA